jgi:hypothetical protein
VLRRDGRLRAFGENLAEAADHVTVAALAGASAALLAGPVPSWAAGSLAVLAAALAAALAARFWPTRTRRPWR